MDQETASWIYWLRDTLGDERISIPASGADTKTGGFLSQLRERIRKQILETSRPMSHELELRIAEEERRIADEVFDRYGSEEDVPEVRE